MELYQDYEFAKVYISVLGKYYILYKDGTIWDCTNKEQMLSIIRKRVREIKNPECLGSPGETIL